MAAYDQAIRLAPASAIMRLEIGTVLVNSNDRGLVEKGLAHLKVAASQAHFARYVYRAMARGFGALGQIGLAELSTAQALIEEKRPKDARRHAERALKHIPKSDRVNRLRAQDIIVAVSGSAGKARKSDGKKK